MCLKGKPAVSQEDKADGSLRVGSKVKKYPFLGYGSESRSVRTGNGGNCVKCSFGLFLPNVMLTVCLRLKKNQNIITNGWYQSFCHLFEILEEGKDRK